MAKRTDLFGSGYAGFGAPTSSCLSTSPEGGVTERMGLWAVAALRYGWCGGLSKTVGTERFNRKEGNVGLRKREGALPNRILQPAIPDPEVLRRWRTRNEGIFPECTVAWVAAGSPATGGVSKMEVDLGSQS